MLLPGHATRLHVSIALSSKFTHSGLNYWSPNDSPYALNVKPAAIGP
jgi:hypothetical protein